jgi:hypothetical protein
LQVLTAELARHRVLLVVRPVFQTLHVLCFKNYKKLS